MNKRSGIDVTVRAALYARVSSERQAERDLSIPAQIKAIRQYADKMGWPVVEQFIDEAESARTADRPQFQRMIGLAKQKPSPFTAILVWKLSRFARNREDSILYKAMLRKHGVQVVSINEPIDDTPAGRMLEGMIEVVDEFYSANLSSDTVRGMKENASRGFQNGGCAPYGYQRVKVKVGDLEKVKLALVSEQAPVVKRIFQMCLDGMGVKEIAKKLNAAGCRTRAGHEWTNTVLYYMLTNEVYTGLTRYNACRHRGAAGANAEDILRVKDTHEALVTREQFEKVRQVLRDRGFAVRHPRSVASDYLLSGILHCGLCEAKMLGTKAKSGEFSYYGCQNYLKKGRAACPAGLVNRDRIENEVLQSLRDQVLTEENLMEMVRLVNAESDRNRESSSERLAGAVAELRGLNGRLDKLYVALESGHVDMADIGPRIKALRAQVEAAEATKREIEAEDAPPLRFGDAETRRAVKDLRELLMEGSLLERKSILRNWLKRVEVDTRRGGTIYYKLPPFAQKAPGRPTEGGPEASVLSIEQIGSGLRTRT